MRTKDAKRIRKGVLRARFRIIGMTQMGISMRDEITADLTGRAFERTINKYKPALESYKIYVGRSDWFSSGGRVKQTFVELVDMRDDERPRAFVREPTFDDLERELKRLAAKA